MDDNRIDVTIPLRNEFAATIRMVAASLGADAGFTLDEIDDFRLGLSEVFAVLTDEHQNERAIASFEISPGQLSATLSVSGSEGAIELDQLASSILASVMDSIDNTERGITMTKRAVEATSSTS